MDSSQSPLLAQVAFRLPPPFPRWFPLPSPPISSLLLTIYDSKSRYTALAHQLFSTMMVLLDIPSNVCSKGWWFSVVGGMLVVLCGYLSLPSTGLLSKVTESEGSTDFWFLPCETKLSCGAIIMTIRVNAIYDRNCYVLAL